MPPKKGKKKGKPALGDWSDDDAVPGDDAVAAEQQPEPPAQAPLQQPKSKKLKGKKAKGKKVDWSDDDEVPAAPAAADEDASDAEVDAPRRSGSGSSHGAAGFSTLPDEEDNEAVEGVDPLEIGDDADSESDDGSEQMPEPVIARITKVSKHPKADRLKVCQADIGSGGGSLQIVTNATVAKDQMVILAPAGCTTPGSAIRVEAAQVRGVDSSGMICSAYDLGWAEEPDGTPAFVPRSAALGSPYPDEPFEEEPEEAEAVQPAAKAKGGKKKKSKRDVSFAALEDEEDLAAAPAEEPADQPQANGHAASEGDDTNAAQEAPQLHRKPKAGKNKKSKRDIGFDMLDEDEDEALSLAAGPAGEPEVNGSLDARDAEGEEPQLQRKQPKKKKQSKRSVSFDMDDEDEVTAAAEGANGAAEGMNFSATAAPEADSDEAFMAASKKGKKKKSSKRSVSFDALDNDDDEASPANDDASAPAATAADGQSATAPEADGEEAFLGGSKKGKKSKANKKQALVDMDSAFAALDVASEQQQPAEPPEPPPDADADADDTVFTGSKSKKKKKKSSKTDVDWAALEADGSDTLPVSAETPAAEQPAAAPSDSGAAPVLPATPAAAAPVPEGNSSKGSKPGADAEEIDALLAELDAPKQPAAETTGSKKKKKKKGGAAEKPADEDLDAILAELGGGAAPAAAAQAAPAAAPAPAAEGATPAADAEPAGLTADDAAEAADDETAEEGGKELSAAAKKKAKRKAKEKAAKTAGGDAGPVAAAGAPAAGEKGKPKKVSAAVRAMQEAQEARARAEEDARRAEEERRRKEEEEERRAAEEAEAKAQREAERKERRAAQRAQLKKEGKLLSGKQKAEAERLAKMREQMLAGANLPTPGDGEAAPAKKKVVYAKKKQAPRKQPSDAAAELEAQAAQEQQQQAELEAARQKQQAAAEAEAAAAAEAAAEKAAEAAAAAAAVDESSDGEDWDAVDPAQVELPAQREARLRAEREAAAAAAAAAAARAAAERAAEEAEQAAARKAAEVQPMEEDDEAGDEEEGADEAGEELGSEEDEESEEESESESEYSSSYESETDSEEARQQRVASSRAAREQRIAAARAAASPDDLRSPICCILGHVDTGKTKILDNVRRTNVQDGEAGGITQQIGATYVPGANIRSRTEDLRKGHEFELKVPGLLIIDTPGHESFTNLRSRGSSLCDIAILVVDLMHSLEPQTIESINLLKQRKTPFIIALNKMDRLYDWKTLTDAPIRKTLDAQEQHVIVEFEQRLSKVKAELMQQGLNTELYWKNPDARTYANIVPTSAITGEGIPDLLQMLVQLTQSRLAQRLMFINELQATVLEVKVIEGLGTTMDVVLVNGLLREGAQVVVCGLGAPIVTTIRSLLTPHPMKELRVKGSYLHHKEVKAAQGIKIAANGLESAVAGTQLLVVGPGDDVALLKEEVMSDMADIFSSVDKGGEGVCVQASTLGSLEALLTFLKSDAVQIPVSGINIGPIHKKDVMRASVMLEKGAKKFAVILAFDVPVTREARDLAESMGVRIFTADIIYHLFDQFTAYLKQVKEEEQEAAKYDAVFPCVLKILPTCIFNKKDPIVLGVEIADGIAKVGTPITVPSQGFVDLGRIASMELNHKAVNSAKKGDNVAMKLEPGNTTEASRLYGRHFDHRDELVSRISRKSINLLKENFRDDLSKDDWRLVVKLKGVFNIQ